MSDPSHIDDGTAAELEDDDEEPMNAKGGFGQAVLAGVIVAAATLVINKATDSSDETKTATSIAVLTTQLGNLTEQVRKLSEQPYATRADLAGVENRVSGLEQRVTEHERQEQPRRQR